MKKNIPKRIFAAFLCICLIFTAFCTESGTLKAEAAVSDNYEGCDFTYEDLFFKAPAYLLKNNAAEHITTMCTNAQADGLKAISSKDTATAVLLEAMANGSSWIFNEIFGIFTTSKAEKMEDELLLELIREYSNTEDSYFRKSEKIASDFQKCFGSYLGKLNDLNEAALIECLKKTKHALKDDEIKKIVDTCYSNKTKILSNIADAMDFTEVVITMLSLQEIELSIIDDLISLQPEDSELTAPLSRLRYDITSNIGEYVLTHYLTDEVIGFIGKKVMGGIWEAAGTGSLAVTLATAAIGVIKMIYEISNPSVSDIVQANLSYTYTKTMERAVSDIQMDFIKNPKNVSETNIGYLETAYSFYLTTMRVSMGKIAKATGKDEANRLKTFIDLLGDGALTYESYFNGCALALQSDINRGIFVMPKETAKDSIENGKPAVGTIVQYSARLAEPSKTDYHYYNVSGCQNPYAQTAGIGMPNCTTYAWGRAWELVGDDWLKYGSAFRGPAYTYWNVNETNHYFPSGQTPAVGALAVYGPAGKNSNGHVAIVENTDEIWQDNNGNYYGYYISHSSYGFTDAHEGFTWGNGVGNNTRNFHYNKVENASWASKHLGPLLGFIYVYSGQGYDDSRNFIIDENGVLTKYNGWQAHVTIPDGVTAIGDNAFYNNTNIQSVVIPDSVTSIGNNAFKRCTNLRYITIPDSVSVIGSSAFSECTSLASAILPLNADFHEIKSSTFEDCKALKQIAVPNSITEIEPYAFSNCSNLANVTLSKSLSLLGYSCFYNCDSLTSIEIPKSLENTYYMVSASVRGPFNNCDNLKTVTFQEGTTKIVYDLFYNCTGLEQLEIPDTITTIESFAFSSCTNLHSIQIPDNVTELREYAFSNCSNLANVTLSKSLSLLGYSCFYNCDSLTSIEIPKSLEYCSYSTYEYQRGPFNNCDNLKTITFQKGTTTIVGDLFSNCTGLEQLEIPDTITTIGNSAFSSCTNLHSIQIPDNVTNLKGYAFYNCSNLTTVTLSKNLSLLGPLCFYNCDCLTSIEIPKSLKDSNAPFHNCDNLKMVTFQEGTTKIVNNLFCNCPGLEQIEIPNTVTAIEDSAFQNCSSLTRVIMHNGTLKELGNNAFSDCTSLPEITIPNSVTDMGTYTFSGCTSLKKAVLPNIRQNLTEGTFQDCTSLTDITLPDSLTAIRANAFRNCDSLTGITIPKNVAVIEDSAFYDCDTLDSILIPEKVTSIGTSAFEDCDALTTAVLSDSVTSIGRYCFKSCDLLSKVTLSASLTAIPSQAFMDCAALQELVVPYRVTSIGSEAFKNNTVLTKITIPKSVTSIDATAFSYPKKLTISGVKDSYANIFATEKGIAFNPINVPASSLTISETKLSLYPNKKADLLAVVKPLNYTGDIVWSSSDPEIVSVTETGKITSRKSGTAEITVTAGKLTKTCTVNVLVPVSNIDLNAYRITMFSDEPLQLEPVITPENAFNKKLLFSSSDESIVTVDANGLVTPHKVGEARVSVKSEDGYASDYCYITVVDRIPATAISLDKQELLLKAGGTQTLTAIVLPENFNGALSWTSSNPEIASVEPGWKKNTAYITGTAPGTTVITASTDGITASCTVQVITPVSSITLEGMDYSRAMTLNAGVPFQLKAIVTPENATNKKLLYASSDESILTVNETGLITPLKAGQARITIKSEDGYAETYCEVTVVESVPAAAVTLDKTELAMLPGALETLTATVTPENFNDALIWSSSDPETVSVTQNGQITALKPGTAVITVSSGSVTASCTVTVKPKEEIPVFDLGDVDHSGTVTTDDALIVLKHAVGIKQSDFDISLADCDGDDKITTDDALLILKIALGII